MASLRIDKKKSGTYLSIIESYRDDQGKPRMRTLHNLGKVEGYAGESLKRIANQLYELSSGEPLLESNPKIKELGRYNYGYVQVCKALVKIFSLDHLFSRIKKKHALSYDLSNVLLLLLAERLNVPCSKLSNYDNREEYIGLEEVSLHWIYRSLDKLSDYKQAVEQSIYITGRTLFNQKLDLVFYDVTTFYFDSEREEEGSLRQKGFGKDGKIGKTQVLFGMLIDEHKQPIAYEVFSGNTYEGHTFEQSLSQLKKRYQIGKVIVVADRGMLNKDNLEFLTEQQGYEFIMGERLKNLPKVVQQQLLDHSKYSKLWVYEKQGEKIQLKYTTLEYADRTIIATYSKKRAKKDKADRDKRIEKAKQLLKKPEKLKTKARRYFIKQSADSAFQLDEDKIKRAEKYDGFVAICTNTTSLSTEQVLDQYRHLFQIEHSFRTFKSHLEIRPMFHWTDSRIKGHICLCFIAYAFLNHLQLRLTKQNLPHSERYIQKAMDKMQMSLIEKDRKRFFLRAKLDEPQLNLLQVLKLQPAPTITPKALINSKL